MNKKIDMDAAHEIAVDLAGTLEHLADIHATMAAIEHNRDHRLMAATLSGLHRHASALAKILEPTGG